jgi:hypothetical protein
MNTTEFLLTVAFLFCTFAPFVATIGISLIIFSAVLNQRHERIANKLLAFGSFLILVPFCFSLFSRIALGAWSN